MSRLNLEVAGAGANANGAAAPTCSTCTHWRNVGRPRTPQGAVDMSVPEQGECRRRRHGMLVQVGPNKFNGIGFYPGAAADTPACGEYEVKVAVGT